MWVHQKPGYILKVGTLCVFYTCAVGGTSSLFFVVRSIFCSPTVNSPGCWVSIQTLTTWCGQLGFRVCEVKHQCELTGNLGKFSKWARCVFFIQISFTVSGKSSLFFPYPFSIHLRFIHLGIRFLYRHWRGQQDLCVCEVKRYCDCVSTPETCFKVGALCVFYTCAVSGIGKSSLFVFFSLPFSIHLLFIHLDIGFPCRHK